MKNTQDNTAVLGAKISVNSSDGSSVYVDVPVDKDGTKSIELPQTGNYTVKISADGFIDNIIQDAFDEDIDIFVALSPELLPEETRIILTWDKNPKDLDIFVMAVSKVNSTTCLTYYGQKNGCEEISLDVDNTNGGLNGAETVTLLNNTINKDYVYIIAVEDYQYSIGNTNGSAFLESWAAVRITNNVADETIGIVTTTLSSDSSKV